MSIKVCFEQKFNCYEIAQAKLISEFQEKKELFLKGKSKTAPVYPAQTQILKEAKVVLSFCKS